MPKISAKVLKTKVNEKGEMLAMIQCNGKLPKEGGLVTVKWQGQGRSLNQNAFYWLFLDFLMTCGLSEDYQDSEELHETLKATFLSKQIPYDKGQTIIKVGSTTALDKIAFAEYIDHINKLMIDFYEIDTSAFFQEYENWRK